MSKKINIAINGFGRIGRAVFKIIHDNHPDYKVVAINDLTDTASLAHLLKHDSVYGIWDKKITHEDNSISVGNSKIKVFSERDPKILPWKKHKVDLVLECTGRFTTKKDLSMHLEAGASKVILSAPSKGEEKVKTVVIGVNEDKILKSDDILSCASCTTNCLAPVTEIIRKKFGIKKALMSTVHAYTADQNLIDGPHRDLRRARSAALNIVPTTTGAAKATSQVIPSVKGVFDGLAIRVPIAVGSLCDTVFILKKKTNLEAVSKLFEKAANEKRYKGIVEASHAPLVSSDIVQNTHSSIVDLAMTKIVDGDMLKVVSWYDNEWGYSCRLVDLIKFLKW